MTQRQADVLLEAAGYRAIENFARERNRAVVEVGFAGWFKVYISYEPDYVDPGYVGRVVPKSEWSKLGKQELKKRLPHLTYQSGIAIDRFKAASHLLASLGFKRRRTTVLVDDLSDRKNHITGGGTGGFADTSSKYMTVAKMLLMREDIKKFAEEVVSHEWAHMYHLLDMNKEQKEYIKAWYDKNVIGGLADKDEKGNVVKELPEKLRKTVAGKFGIFMEQVIERRNGLSLRGIYTVWSVLKEVGWLDNPPAGRYTTGAALAAFSLMTGIADADTNEQGLQSVKLKEVIDAGGPYKLHNASEFGSDVRKFMFVSSDLEGMVELTAKEVADWLVWPTTSSVKTRNAVTEAVASCLSPDNIPHIPIIGNPNVLADYIVTVNGMLENEPESAMMYGWLDGRETLEKIAKFMVKAVKAGDNTGIAFRDAAWLYANWEVTPPEAMQWRMDKPHGKGLRDRALMKGNVPTAYGAANDKELWAATVQRAVYGTDKQTRKFKQIIKDIESGEYATKLRALKKSVGESETVECHIERRSLKGSNVRGQLTNKSGRDTVTDGR